MVALFPHKNIISMDSDAAITALYDVADIKGLLGLPDKGITPGMYTVTERTHIANAGIVIIVGDPSASRRTPLMAVQHITYRKACLMNGGEPGVTLPDQELTPTGHWERCHRETIFEETPYYHAMAKEPIDYLNIWTDIGAIMCQFGLPHEAKRKCKALPHAGIHTPITGSARGHHP